MKTKQPESERKIAARLTAETGRKIGRSTVRRLARNGIDLTNPEAVQHELANQERQPPLVDHPPAAGPKPADRTNQPDQGEMLKPLTAAELDQRIGELQTKLLTASDYHESRNFRVQISGLRELFKLQVDRGYYVTKESQIRDGMGIASVIRGEILRIPAEVPQMLIGLDYADAVGRCEDFADRILTILADERSYREK